MPKPQTGSYFCPPHSEIPILTMSTLFIDYKVRMQPVNPPETFAKVIIRQSDAPLYREYDLRYGEEVGFITYGLIFRVFIRAFARGVVVDIV
jgi:hypothetical protein